MAKQLPPNSVIITARLSFPHLFKPSASVEGGKEKYRASFLIDPNTAEGKADIKKIEAIKKEIELEKFKKSPKTYKNPDRCCFREGDSFISRKSDEPYDGYEGMMVVVASNDRRPVIVDRDRQPLNADDGKPYAGCWVKANLRFYGVNDVAKGGDGFFCGLEAVQFVKDGEAFGAAPVDAEDIFDDLSEETEDDLIG